jgi:hypothetical protein
MQFRAAIRNLPENVVDEFLTQQENPELKQLNNYHRFLHLILFHQLPRTEAERLEARRQADLAFAEMKRRDIQGRAAAHERKLLRLTEKRRIAAEKHGERQIESARRRQFREEVAAMPVPGRIKLMLANPHICPAFFQPRPEEVTDAQIEAMEPASRAALADRISHMRHPSWRRLRTRLSLQSAGPTIPTCPRCSP